MAQEAYIKMIVQNILHKFGVIEHPVERFGNEEIDFDEFCANLSPVIKRGVGSRLIRSLPRDARIIKNRVLPFIGTLDEFSHEFSDMYHLAFNALDEAIKEEIKTKTAEEYARWCLMRDTRVLDFRSHRDLDYIGETAIYSPAAFLCRLKFPSHPILRQKTA